jgi:hypothetical protein
MLAPAMPHFRRGAIYSHERLYPTGEGGAAARESCRSVSPNEHKRAALLCDALLNEGMWGEDMIRLEIDPERVWSLSDNGKQILMELPPLLLPGHDEAILVRMRFNAEIIDGFLERLTSLRSMVLPART